MEFSKRTAWNTEESDLAKAYRDRVAAGLPIIDLTIANPTRCGFTYSEQLLAPLGEIEAFDYDPNPLGSLRAREAVNHYYQSGASRADVNNILLTTSTSEAYGYLFKLLCNPGDELLTPVPSYPLFDFLADAEMVTVVQTPLVYDHGWQIDLGELRRRITPRTRAVLVVHPNNPTGQFMKLEESLELAEICRKHGLALIVDEVFLDYVLSSGIELRFGDRQSFAARNLDVLMFIVSGLSKIAGLPQMKVGWIVAMGPGSAEAMSRLEVLADTYLSVNAPMQRALPVWLKDRGRIQEQIRERTRLNLAELDRVLAEQPGGKTSVNRLVIEGGWYAVLRIPATETDELVVLELLKRGIWVHPGHFFGFGVSGWLVICLLIPVNEFSTGIVGFVEYFG